MIGGVAHTHTHTHTHSTRNIWSNNDHSRHCPNVMLFILPVVLFCNAPAFPLCALNQYLHVHSHLCCTCMTCDTHTPSHPSAADEAWYWQNTSCTLGDCLTSRPEGCSQPRELWFSIYIHICALCSYYTIFCWSNFQLFYCNTEDASIYM